MNKSITSAFNRIIYQSLAASSIVAVVLDAPGHWTNLCKEIEFLAGKDLLSNNPGFSCSSLTDMFNWNDDL